MRKTGSGRLASAVFAALLTSATLSQPVSAQEIRLKFGHVFAPDHWVWVEGGQVFIDTLSELTDQVAFDVFPGGQLGNDYVTALKSGLADVAILAPGYTPDSFILTSVVELPHQIATSCEGTERFWQVAKEGGILHEAEYAPQGFRPLLVFFNPPYQVMTTKKKLETVADIEGLKLRAGGTAMRMTAAALGAVPVQVAGPDLYESLSRGTIDGGLLHYTTITPNSLEGIVKYSLDGVRVGGLSTLFGISEQKWKEIPDDLKEKFKEAAMRTQIHLCEYLDEQTRSIREMLVTERGWEVTTLGADQADIWNSRLETVFEKWVEDVDSTGRPGTEALDAFIKTAAETK